MTLTNRISTFFLVVLALVLAGFTGSLYLLARSYLWGEVNDRLNAAIDTLTASVEIKTPQLLEWEPQKHQLTTGTEDDLEESRWIVRDRFNQVVDRSRNLNNSAEFSPLLTLTEYAPSTELGGTGTIEAAGQSWRLRSVRLFPPNPPPPTGTPTKIGRKKVFPELVVSAVVSLKPAEDKLKALMIGTTALSAGLWLAAAFMGRWLCRRALRPLNRMALAAQSLPATELHRRIPLPGTRDELDELGVAFNELLGRVQVAMTRQQWFASQASHQLRTPLAILLGQIEVALRRERTPEEYRQVLARAESKGHHLTRIIEALLFLTRAETEGALPELVDVDVASWLPDHLAKWGGHARLPDISWEIVDAPILAIAHRELLGQAVDNLLENACKYSQPGSPIRLIAQQIAGSVRLQVEDHGIGMNQEDLAHVFDPFFRSPRARERGIAGNGLGLSVVRRIASAFGGSIHVHSVVGQGSTFTLELRASLRSATDSPSWDEAAPGSPSLQVGS